MPRFLEIHASCLKRTMLTKSPAFVFDPADVEALVEETGLNQAQVQQWARAFRFRRRHKSRDETMAHLSSGKQEKSARLTRYFVSCFNITPEFFNGIELPRCKGGGVFSIKYMEAVFNKEAESGEIFIEFVEPVYENKLIECFESQGACQVTTVTFAHNDKDDSAANALVRILLAQEKHGGCSRGACPAPLYDKAMAKRTEAKQKLQTVSQQEFDEKTAAAIRFSLGNIETGVQSQAVKLDGIEQGVCHVIPDYQNEIAKLKDALAKKTAACDTIEGKLAYKTRLVNQLEVFVVKLEEAQVQHVKDTQAWTHEKASMQSQITALQEQLDLCRSIAHLREMQESMQHTANVLSSTLAEERAAKRARTQE